MKTMKALFLLVLAVCWLALNSFAASRDAEWKLVEDAINKGLPQTAITNLQPIITAAIRDKAWGEAAKAIAQLCGLNFAWRVHRFRLILILARRKRLYWRSSARTLSSW